REHAVLRSGCADRAEQRVATDERPRGALAALALHEEHVTVDGDLRAVLRGLGLRLLEARHRLRLIETMDDNRAVRLVALEALHAERQALDLLERIEAARGLELREALGGLLHELCRELLPECALLQLREVE